MNPLTPILKSNKQGGYSYKQPPSKTLKLKRLTSKVIEDHNRWRQDVLEKREDNDQRREKVNRLLNDFSLCYAVIEAPNAVLTPTELSKIISNALSVAESILAYYNIRLDIITQSTADSASKITGIKSYESLLKLMHELIPKICAFPYSFIACLGIRSISFCEDISMVNAHHSAFYHNKLYNGIFPVKQLTSQEGIDNHLHKVMMQNLFKNNSKFAHEWKTVLTNTRSRAHKEGHEHKDLTKVFIMLLERKQGKVVGLTQEMMIKVYELQRILKEFDPAGVNIEWEEVDIEEEKENMVFLTLNNPKSA